MPFIRNNSILFIYTENNIKISYKTFSLIHITYNVHVYHIIYIIITTLVQIKNHLAFINTISIYILHNTY